MLEFACPHCGNKIHVKESAAGLKGTCKSCGKRIQVPMTPDQLIAEGRRLERPCVFLRPRGSGPVAAVWHDDSEIDSTGHRCWLTVDARQVPGLLESIGGYLSIFTDDETYEGGRVDRSSTWPNRGGTPLYAHAASVLAPIDAVFARGSEVVGQWIRSHGWERTVRYNDNFGDAAVVRKYEEVWSDEYPLYGSDDIYAVLGGWHWPGPDDDWHDLIDERLMVLTKRDSEPWVEAWHLRSGGFRVIQRIT
jgi:hypothetical protein